MRFSPKEIEARAKAFSLRWADAANEKALAQSFWLDFFEIFGITNKRVSTFEHHVKKLSGRNGFIDLFWPGTLLVEHKSKGENLDKALDQAMGYIQVLPEHDLPELVVLCDFARFRVRLIPDKTRLRGPGRTTTDAPPSGATDATDDATSGISDTVEFELRHLHKHVRLFRGLVGQKPLTLAPEDPVNIKAAESMGRLHDALKAGHYEGHDLEVMLVRLLFCLFADDTGIFQPAHVFHDFVTEHTAVDGSDLGARLAQLFQTLNTPDGSVPGQPSQRSTHLDDALAAFPYINGKLFEETIRIADFDAKMRQALITASALDWSQISPAIFGSLFQSIMDTQKRRDLGAHYTSESNILKVIQPLFLDELHQEFERIAHNPKALQAFHIKLQTLTFFDPACGCGNFLIISYRELRELELLVLRALHHLGVNRGQLALDVRTLIRVNVHQFFGIEIEEFPAQIAQVAMWLVDHQLNLRVSEEFGQSFVRIPLINSATIRHANALTTDWQDVLPAHQCSYVLGNPPFLGYAQQSQNQKADLAPLTKNIQGGKVLDFVCGWYLKAAHYIQPVGNALEYGFAAPQPASNATQPNGHTQCAFVSTNSIVQGEHVSVLWGEMQRLGISIRFAHRTFQWSNEARGKAAVHCVIIGFGLPTNQPKTIFQYDTIRSEPKPTSARNINAYLLDAPHVFVSKRKVPICRAQPMTRGSAPVDGGHLLLNTEELDSLLQQERPAAEWVRPFIMGSEFINNIPRWCLWLYGVAPDQLRGLPKVMERAEMVRAFRLASAKQATRLLADTPTHFGEVRQPIGDIYLAIPIVSSERRKFIPIAFVSSKIVCGNKLFYIDDGSLYSFGMLCSTMHNAWMRTTAGRLKSDYSYSNTIVYNNYPWPHGTSAEGLDPKLREPIEQRAQGVLNARARYPNASLADLYDPLTMPPELVKAHQQLDAAVDKAYIPLGGKKTWRNDADRVAFLFTLYEQLTATEKQK